MIIFGGGQFRSFHYDPLFSDTWILSCANCLEGSVWNSVPDATLKPLPREGNGAFYRSATNEMVIFGGADNGILSVPADLWVLKNANGLGGTPVWNQLPQTGDVPGPLEHFATAYDPASNRMTIVGGCCFYTNATRLLDFNSPNGAPQWSTLSPGGVLPSSGDALIFGNDQGDNRLVVHGILPGGNSNATWLLVNANDVGVAPVWFNSVPRGAPSSPPEGAFLVGSAYNATTKQLILALNRNDGQGNLVPEVWVLNSADRDSQGH
jgi:hypothetical protein